MFSPLPNRRRFLGSGSLSVAVHAMAAGVFLFSMRLHPVHVSNLPGTASGTRVEIAYLPGRAPTPTLHPQARVKPRAQSAAQIHPSPAPPASPPLPDALHPPPLPHLTVTEAAPSANVSAPASPTPDSSTGSDSWGSGAVQIALTTYSQPRTGPLSTSPRYTGRCDRRCDHRSQREGRRLAVLILWVTASNPA